MCFCDLEKDNEIRSGQVSDEDGNSHLNNNSPSVSRPKKQERLAKIPPFPDKVVMSRS